MNTNRQMNHCFHILLDQHQLTQISALTQPCLAASLRSEREHKFPMGKAVMTQAGVVIRSLGEDDRLGACGCFMHWEKS